MTMKSEKIMWVHPDTPKMSNATQKKSKLKGKHCNVVSVLLDDDNITIASLSDSEDEKHALAVHDTAPQLQVLGLGNHT